MILLLFLLLLCTAMLSVLVIMVRLYQLLPYAKDVHDQITLTTSWWIWVALDESRFEKEGERYRQSAIFWYRLGMVSGLGAFLLGVAAGSLQR